MFGECFVMVRYCCSSLVNCQTACSEHISAEVKVHIWSRNGKLRHMKPFLKAWMECQRERETIRNRCLTPEVTIELSTPSRSACGGGASGGHLVWKSKAGEIGAVSKGMMDGEREMAFGRKDDSREPWSRLRLSREIPPSGEV